MTASNFRFIRNLTGGVRIRRITEENRGRFSAYLDNDPEYMEEYGEYELADFGLEAEGEPVAAISLAVVDDHVVIANILVDKNRRHMGYGSALLVRAKEYAIECGCSFAAFELFKDTKSFMPFFRENGFYPVEDREAEGFPVVWEESFEIDSIEVGEEEETAEAVKAMPVFTEIIVPKLMRLKRFLQSDGADGEVVTGENACLWTDCGVYDVQLSYLVRDNALRQFYLVFSTFIKYEASDEKLFDLCRAVNDDAFFATAIPGEGGLILRYVLMEASDFVDEPTFIGTLDEFKNEADKVLARIE